MCSVLFLKLITDYPCVYQQTQRELAAVEEDNIQINRALSLHEAASSLTTQVCAAHAPFRANLHLHPYFLFLRHSFFVNRGAGPQQLPYRREASIPNGTRSCTTRSSQK